MVSKAFAVFSGYPLATVDTLKDEGDNNHYEQ